VGAENVMRTLLALVLATLMSTSVLAADDHELWREARLRPQDPRLADLLRAGVARSETFRSLVNRIESGNVFVYVTLSPMRSHLVGKLTWMSKAGLHRYLKATLSIEQSADQMIATLAHELQHALEVSAHEDVVDQRSLIELYKRIGRPSYLPGVSSWETKAAQQTALQVRRELISGEATAAADDVAPARYGAKGTDRSQS
jgi:hypothetical protein